MKKLEKSIRREMKYYGPRLRAGHYGVAGCITGIVPSDFSTISGIFCDVEDGEVTDIRLYCVGDAEERRDYYGESIDITEPVKRYLMGMSEWSWSAMIREIVDTINEELAANNEEEVAPMKNTVTNESGVQIDYAAAVALMDDETREELAAELAPCTDQEFFTAYEEVHLVKFGAPWELSKPNPIF